VLAFLVAARFAALIVSLPPYQFARDRRHHDSEMEPQGKGSVSSLRTRRRNGALGLRKTTLRSRVHVQTVGLNAETKKDRHRAGRGGFSLDIPFYRTCTICALKRSRPAADASRGMYGAVVA